MPTGRFRPAAAALLFAAMVPLAISQDLDPAKQKEAQKALKAKIESMARRAGSTVDAMIYQRLSANAEQKMLEEVAASLRGLSEEQITSVLSHLEAAIKAPDESTATKEQKEAYTKHRQIITQLRSMVVKLDVIKNLEEASARLDRAADKQIEINGTTLNTLHPANARTNSGRRPSAPLSDDREDISNEQSDLRAEVAAVAKQMQGLVPFLTKEQKEQVEKADAISRGNRLVGEMDLTVRTARQGNFDDAGERQRRHAKELKDLASALRTPAGNKLDALKAAREKVEKAMEAQAKVNQETAQSKDKAEQKTRNFDPKQALGNEIANEQAKAELATRDARKTTEQVAPETAEMIKPAESAQWKAEDKLRNADLEGAKAPEETALEALKDAKKDLDRQIAAAEEAKKDPLIAVKQAAAEIEALIKEQKEALAKTEKAEANSDQLPEAKTAQKDVSKKTDELRATPLPPNMDVKNALDKAAEDMKQANANLDKKQPEEAQPNQKDAIKDLEDAKKALDAQAAAIEQRRDEIAKLEEAKKKLEELAKEQKKVADEATAKANDPAKPDTNDTAKKQDAITPPTKDVGETLKDLAPDASKKVDEANQKQDAAKSDLEKSKNPEAGAEKAKDAEMKLGEALKDLDKALAEKKGMEANDQAALQPDKDAMAAAQQLQKAIEQALEAEAKANEAVDKLKGQDLAELQKQIAERADKLQQPDASKDAAAAAKALDKGDLPAAIEKQEAALEKLNKAEKNQPKDGMLKDGMAKDGMPKDGMPKDGMPKDGSPSDAKTPGELGMAQQQVLDATKAIQQSREATDAALAALAQALANAPNAVQPQIDQANKALDMAGNQLGMGKPGEAGMNQAKAADALQQALDAVNSAMAQANGMGMGMGMGMPMPGMGEGMGMGMGMGQGQAQGKGMGKAQAQAKGNGKEPGKGEPDNKGISEGDKDGPEKLKNAASSGNNQAGDGGFIHLRKREREKVQQSAEAQFPAEFRELIKQYNINIKNNGAMPAKPPSK